MPACMSTVGPWVRGTQQNNQTQAAHAEYKVRFQPINDDNDFWPTAGGGYTKLCLRERSVFFGYVDDKKTRFG